MDKHELHNSRGGQNGRRPRRLHADQQHDSDPRERPFTPDVLDKTVITVPLLDILEKEERQARKKKAKTTKPQRHPIIIDLNLEFPGGRQRARAEVLEKLIPQAITNVHAQPGERIDRLKSRWSQQYLFGEMEATVIRELVRLDTQDEVDVVSDLTQRVGGRRAIYRQEINGYGRRLFVHGVNMSVGYEFEPKWFACGQSPLCVEVDRLMRSGVVVVVASGNTGYGITQISATRSVSSGLDLSINDPGNAELAITVGSTHREMPHIYGVSYFSSKGPTGDGRLKPDLIAPGEKIISCDSYQRRLARGLEPVARETATPLAQARPRTTVQPAPTTCRNSHRHGDCHRHGDSRRAPTALRKIYASALSRRQWHQHGRATCLRRDRRLSLRAPRIYWPSRASQRDLPVDGD